MSALKVSFEWSVGGGEVCVCVWGGGAGGWGSVLRLPRSKTMKKKKSKETKLDVEKKSCLKLEKKHNQSKPKKENQN